MYYNLSFFWKKVISLYLNLKTSNLKKALNLKAPKSWNLKFHKLTLISIWFTLNKSYSNLREKRITKERGKKKEKKKKAKLALLTRRQ